MGAILGYGGLLVGFAVVVYIIYKILEPIYLNLKNYESLDNYFFKPLFFMFKVLSYPIFAIGFLLSKIPEIFDFFTDFLGSLFYGFFAVILKIIFIPIRLLLKIFKSSKNDRFP